MDKAKIDRINELSRLARQRTLTAAEQNERAILRTEYINDFRASMTGILDNSVIVRPDGTREKVKDRRAKPADKAETVLIPSKTVTHSTSQTEKIGSQLASLLGASPELPRFIALYGDLGVGKTAFVRGFTSLLAPDAKVKSPTFALVHEYGTKPTPVFHFDMYRITDDDDLYSIGFYDYFSRGGYMLTEWSENIPYALPDDYLSVTIEKTCSADENERCITIQRRTK